jgi:hypothetical protein
MDEVGVMHGVMQAPDSKLQILNTVQIQKVQFPKAATRKFVLGVWWGFGISNLGLIVRAQQKMEAAIGFEPMNEGFADLCLSHLATPP